MGLVASLATVAAAEEPERAYDPNAGIDPDGRIPIVERPPQLEHPERWRYIPEARIKPGNVLERFLVSSFIAPILFHDSDIGTGFGVSITDIDFREQRRREFAGVFASYTTEGEVTTSFAWRRRLRTLDLPEGGVLQDERSGFGFRVGYRKTLTRRFFGLGSRTRERDESSYTDEAIEGSAGFSLGLYGPLDNVVVEGGLSGEFHELSGGERDPSMDLAFPAIFDDSEHDDIGWLRLGLRYDTRDSQRNPYQGWHVGGNLDFAPVQTGSHVGALYTVDASKVFRVPPLFHDGGDLMEEHPPTDTIAVGFLTQHTSGRLPFFHLPTLGGSYTQRGFIPGRFRGRSSWHLPVEYRFWVIPRGFGFSPTFRIERIGLAVFYEAGAVGDDLPDLFDAKIRHSYGLGLRISLERAAPFRLDVGFSDEMINFTARFGLSF